MELLSLRHLLVSSAPLSNLLSRIRQNEAMTAQIRALLPADLAPHLAAALMQGGRLVLLAPSPVWASRLRFAVPHLRDGLAEILDIRVKVLPETPAKPDALRRPRRARNLSPQTAEQIRVVAATPSDPELGAALRRLAAHSDGRLAPASRQETGTGRM